MCVHDTARIVPCANRYSGARCGDVPSDRDALLRVCAYQIRKREAAMTQGLRDLAMQAAAIAQDAGEHALTDQVTPKDLSSLYSLTRDYSRHDTARICSG